MRSYTGVQHYVIYALRDPRDESIRYVGQTAATLNQRVEEHCTKDITKRTAKSAWLRELQAQHLRPIGVLLDEFDGLRERAYREESRWISLLHRAGQPLLNAGLPKLEET